MNTFRSAGTEAVRFNEWREVLAKVDWPAGAASLVRGAVLALLSHCRQQRRPVSVAMIREHLAKLPGGSLQRTHAREALRWFYTQGSYRPQLPGVTAVRGSSRPDHPSLARDDLGGADWERDLIRAIRERGLLWRTEQTYRAWAARFVRTLTGRSPYATGREDVGRFLSDLATIERASPATQKQALNALVFFLQEGLKREVGELDFCRSRRRPKLPVVLSLDECRRLFAQLDGTPRLMAELAYGAGLRLMELLRLRIHHVDFERGQLQIWA